VGPWQVLETDLKEGDDLVGQVILTMTDACVRRVTQALGSSGTLQYSKSFEEINRGNPEVPAVFCFFVLDTYKCGFDANFSNFVP